MRGYSLKNITLEHLAAIISSKLQEYKIDSILVGGACVSIYSQNRYQSYDLDYVTYEDMKKVAEALHKLGFVKKGKYFSQAHCQFYIEFVSPPVSIGKEPISHFEQYQTPLGTIKMLTPTDCVKDRLAGYYHWEDRQSLDQAITICRQQKKRINLQEIKNWSEKEGHLKEFEIFQKKLLVKTNQKL